jgi:hypothetical protein
MELLVFERHPLDLMDMVIEKMQPLCQRVHPFRKVLIHRIADD